MVDSNPTMKDTHTLNPDVEFRRLGDRMVLVHLETNQVYELNSTGARVWELLEAGAQADEILDRLTEEFEVEGKQLRQDIGDLLGELTSAGLIS
jgi:PqqD family protein of HPr-rel-A system